jgi:hypothetical protein
MMDLLSFRIPLSSNVNVVTPTHANPSQGPCHQANGHVFQTTAKPMSARCQRRLRRRPEICGAGYKPRVAELRDNPVNPVKRLAIVAAAGAVSAVLISGCGSSTTTVAAAPVTSASSYMTPAAPTSVLQMRFPVDAYELTTLQSAQLLYLTQRLRQQCMRSFGFDYLPNLSTGMISPQVRATDEHLTRLYGISDATAARTYGYHMPTWVTETAGGAAIGQLSRAEQAVLTGQGATSYDGRAIPTATPYDAGGDPRWQTASAASPTEIQTTRHDITCKLRVNLLGVEYTVQSGYETTAIAKNSQALAPITASLGPEATAISHLMTQYP